MSGRHGTYITYKTGACRCRDCTDAWAAYCRERMRQQAEGYASRASEQEVRLWSASLGFSLPRQTQAPRLLKQRELLIERYNREHPDRPYLRPSERGGAS